MLTCTICHIVLKDAYRLSADATKDSPLEHHNACRTCVPEVLRYFEEKFGHSTRRLFIKSVP